MANPKTLKPFQKGYDPRRNTKGRPISKWAPWKKALDKELKRKTGDSVNGQPVTVEVEVIMALIRKAHAGHMPAVRLLFNYLYGKPPSYCTRCERRNEAELAAQQERLKREAMLKSGEEQRRIAREMEEVDEWIEGWFPEKPKKKRK